MDQVEEIKRKTDIVRLVSEYVVLKKFGRNHKGLCPFHAEKTPSFMVNEELGIYKCFGCGEGGDAIKFLMEVEGIEFREALKRLADRAGVELVDHHDWEADKRRELFEVNNLAMEYYHYLLTKHKAGEEARKYLDGRDLGDKLITTFKIGYALPEWDGLTRYLTKKKNFTKEILIKSGLVVEKDSRIYDRFRGRVMFPLFDNGGKVVGFSGRILPQYATDSDAKYVNTPETEIYHKSRMLYGFNVVKQEIRKKKRVVIVEGELDMISSFANGVTETVGIKGSVLTAEMIETLARLANTFVLSLDNDAAGEAAMKRSIDAAEERGLSIKIVELSGGKDPDEIARKNPKQWRELVEKAVPVYEFFFNKALEHNGTNSVEAIKKVVTEVVPLLAKIDNSVVREVWAKRLAEKLGVETNRVYEEIEKVRSGRSVNTVEEKKETTVSTEEKDIPLELLGIILAAPKETILKLKKQLLGLPLVGAGGKILGEVFSQEGIVSLDDFVKNLPSELQAMATEASLRIPDGEMTEREIFKNVYRWVNVFIKNQREKIRERMEKAENGGESVAVDNLAMELVKLDALANKLILV